MASRNTLVRDCDLTRSTYSLSGTLEVNGVNVIEAIENAGATTTIINALDTNVTRAKTVQSFASLARLEDLTDPQMILIMDPQTDFSKTVKCRLYANSGPDNFKLKAYSFVLYWNPANVTLSKLTMGDNYAPWDGITLGYRLGADSAPAPTPQVRYYQFGSGSYSSYVNMDQIGVESYYNLPCVRCVCTQSSEDSPWNAPGALTAGFNVGKAIPVAVFEFTLPNTWTGQRECIPFGFCNDFINQGTQDYSSLMAHRTTNDGFTWAYGTYPGTYVESSKIPMVDSNFVGTWNRFNAYFDNRQTTVEADSISTGALTLSSTLAIPGYASVATALAEASSGTSLVQRTDNGAISGDVWGLTDGWPAVPATNDTDLATIALLDTVFAKTATSVPPVLYSAYFSGNVNTSGVLSYVIGSDSGSWVPSISNPNVSVSNGVFTITRAGTYRIRATLHAQANTILEATLFVNETPIAFTSLDSQSTEQTVGIYQITSLAANDQITIRSYEMQILSGFAPYSTWMTFEEVAAYTVVGITQDLGDTLYQPLTGDVTVTGVLAIPGYANVGTTLTTLGSDVSARITQATADTLYQPLIGDVTITGILSIPNYTDVEKSLRDLNVALDDIVLTKITQSTADTLYQPLIGDVTVTGTLAIPGYADVASTLGSLGGGLTQAVADTLYQPLSGNVTVTGTLAIPGYTDVASTLSTYATDISGKLSQATADTLYQPLTGNVTVTGTLAIPGYADVASTLGGKLDSAGLTNATDLSVAKTLNVTSGCITLSSFITESFSANKLTYATSGGFSWYGETPDHNADLDPQTDQQISLRMDYGVRTPQIYITSDDRIKVRETPITGALAALDKLTPVFYQKLTGGAMVAADYEDAPPQGVGWVAESGFVAQDVFNNCPEIAPFVNPGGIDPATGEETIWSLKYDSIFTWGIAATRELAAKVAALEARIAALEAA